MSHWTKSKVSIRRLDVMRKVAEKMGLSVEEGNLTFSSIYAGSVKASMILTGTEGGQMALVREKDGTFTTLIDSYCNPIAHIVGKNCENLTRDYTAELTRTQVRAMGGMVTKETILQDGSIQLRVSVGV